MENANEISVMITGQAGQGIETIGLALARLFKDSGFYIFANRDYMSRIRGGNNFVQLRVSDRPVHSPRRDADIIFCLDGDSVAMRLGQIAANGVMVADLGKFGISVSDRRVFDVPMYDLATRVGGSEMFVNTVGLGLIAAITQRGFPQVQSVIRDTFRDKGEDIVNKNIGVALAAYDTARDNQSRFSGISFNVNPVVPGQRRMFLNGHDALSIGAVKGGCKFFSGYPMTPATSILQLMAKFAPEYGIVVEQAEDEIAAVNMAVGASYAGARSMTATSGGGFCLMTEGLSLSAMTESPLVVVLSMRPGPATGFPTRTSQDTLDFCLSAGHGEFARCVYTPGTIEQGFYHAVKALNTADKYQLPVIILTDQHFADSYMNIPLFDTEKIKVERYAMRNTGDDRGYARYRATGSGLSPRAVPSWIEGKVYADSDEHTEEGHITEDAALGRQNVEKRLYRKMEMLGREIEKPYAENIEGADMILVGFGSTYGVMKDACAGYRERKTGFIHLSQVWPFPSEELQTLLDGSEAAIFTVENNAGAQFAQLLFREAAIEADGSILKYDGRPFSLDEVVEQLQDA